MPPPSDERPVAVLAALGANLAIAAAKAVAFLVTGAASLLAEAIHSVADSANQALLLLGRHRSRRPPSAEHPFGFGQEAYFWAFLVAVVLFSVGSGFSLVEGYEKLRAPHEVESPAWAIGVLVVAMAFEGFSLTTAVRRVGPSRRGSWWRYVRETRAPDTVVVLLEDSAAELGLTAALAGVVLTTVTGDARWDALGSVAIGLLLGVVAFVLAREMRSLLIGEAVGDEDLAALRSVLDDDPAVARVVDLRTMHLGPTDVLVAARLELQPGAGDDRGRALEDLRGDLHRAVPAADHIYLQPVDGDC